MKKNVSTLSIIILILVIISMAAVTIGIERQNIVLVISGMALAFASIVMGSLVSSVININKRFPLRGDPAHKKMRAVRYLRLTSSIVITLGVIMMLVGIFTQAQGVDLPLYIAWALLTLGFGTAIAGSVINTVISKNMPESQMIFDAAVPPASAVSAQMPYSPDPVISRILATPYVLQDERIKQLPEVQNLLQYPEIQQVFFEPTKLYELFTQDRVGELLNIVRGRLTQNDGEEIFAAAEQRRPVNMPQTVQADKTARSSTEKKSSAGLVILFIVVWLTIFISIAFTVLRSVFGT